MLCVGTRRVLRQPPAHFGMARQVDKNTGETARVQICGDGIPVPRRSDARAVSQHMETGKPINLDAELNRISSSCWRRQRHDRSQNRERSRKESRSASSYHSLLLSHIEVIAVQTGCFDFGSRVVASLVSHPVKLRIEMLVCAFLQARSGNLRSRFADDICEG